MRCMRGFLLFQSRANEAVYLAQNSEKCLLAASTVRFFRRAAANGGLRSPQLCHPTRIFQRNLMHAFSRNGHYGTSRNLPEDDPTIYALSSAPGRAAIAIVRCSGTRCLDVYRKLCPKTPIPKPRRAIVRSLFSPISAARGGQILDSEALVLYFPAPQTATGEDVLEFHVHGGNAVVKAVLAAIGDVDTELQTQGPRIRYAEPGEFTKRAFFNGRLDLTQAEALGDTLSAETEEQRHLAVRGTRTTLHERYEAWRKILLAARGELEALIDFSEDQHFDDSPTEFIRSVSSQVIDLRARISASLRNAARGELLRSGIRIALLGAPNVGKSSLLNQIVGREAAIVSAEAGTTRDVVEINVDIGGFFCKFSDLAGVRSANKSGQSSSVGPIEQEGIQRAKNNAVAADVVIVVTPFAKDEDMKEGYRANLDPTIAEFLISHIKPHQRVLHVLNKSDLVGEVQDKSVVEAAATDFANISGDPQLIFPLSCLLAKSDSSGSAASEDRSGFRSFLDGLMSELQALTAAEHVAMSETDATVPLAAGRRVFDESLGSTERQRSLLETCDRHLARFLSDVRMTSSTSDRAPRTSQLADVEGDIDIVVAAERLRAAAECLGKVTGRGEGGDAEEVLGVVFEKFCVGK